jgi:hypothetical protein
MGVIDTKFEVSWCRVAAGIGYIMIRETVTGTKGFAEYGPMSEADGLAFVEARKQYWSAVVANTMKHLMARCTVGKLSV